jgi:hypothetical protein
MKNVDKKHIRSTVEETLNQLIGTYQIEKPSKKTQKVISKASKKLSRELNEQLKKQTKKMVKAGKALSKHESVAA